ncbi:phage neck terminator protein [Indiicoccus explosivorum]|uniref:phage neck terminator protein n=1 Tax=Indiicoccus explosivorum TaxID=1917864 RepID=UPI000B449439|nr:hypothetical protein [Indiicoccus explosivorum]
MISVSIRNALVQALYNHLQIPIIPDDDDGEIPERPYVLYSVIRDNGKNGHDSITHGETAAGFVKTYANQKEATYSFTAHSENRDEALDYCYGLIEYFERTGRTLLADHGIAVIEVSSTQNRSVLLGDHYERRHGIDVRIRYVDSSKYQEEPMDEINI